MKRFEFLAASHKFNPVNVKTLSITAEGSFPHKELRRGRPAERRGGLEQFICRVSRIITLDICPEVPIDSRIVREQG